MASEADSASGPPSPAAAPGGVGGGQNFPPNQANMAAAASYEDPRNEIFFRLQLAPSNIVTTVVDTAVMALQRHGNFLGETPIPLPSDSRPNKLAWVKSWDLATEKYLDTKFQYFFPDPQNRHIIKTEIAHKFYEIAMPVLGLPPLNEQDKRAINTSNNPFKPLLERVIQNLPNDGSGAMRQMKDLRAHLEKFKKATSKISAEGYRLEVKVLRTFLHTLYPPIDSRRNCEGESSLEAHIYTNIYESLAESSSLAVSFSTITMVHQQDSEDPFYTI